MLEIENLLSAPVVTRMGGDKRAVMFNLDLGRPDMSGNAQIRPQRSRVPVRLHPQAAFAIHLQWVNYFVDFEALLDQRQQMRLFHSEGFAHRYGFAAGSVLAFDARGQ